MSPEARAQTTSSSCLASRAGPLDARRMRHVVIGLLVVACKGNSQQQQQQQPGEPAAPGQAMVKLAPRDPGSCTLKATGAVTAEATSPGGRTAVGSKHWSSDGEAGAAPAGLIINCASKDLRLSIVTKPDTPVPFAPKLYSVDGKSGDLAILGRALAVIPHRFQGQRRDHDLRRHACRRADRADGQAHPRRWHRLARRPLRSHVPGLQQLRAVITASRVRARAGRCPSSAVPRDRRARRAVRARS